MGTGVRGSGRLGEQGQGQHWGRDSQPGRGKVGNRGRGRVGDRGKGQNRGQGQSRAGQV